MSVLTPSAVLSDVVLGNVSLLPVLNRFGIPTGLGNATVSEICKENDIDLSFFLFVTNNYLDPTYSGQLTLTNEHIRLTADYLEHANADYLGTQLPNIRIHLTSFLKRSDPDPTVSQNILRFLGELEEEVRGNVERDAKELFPKFRRMQADETFQIPDWSLDSTEAREEDAFGALKYIVEDLMQILIRYIKGTFDPNLLHGVIFALSTFRNDLESNSRLRVRVFFPILNALKERLDRQKK